MSNRHIRLSWCRLGDPFESRGVRVKLSRPISYVSNLNGSTQTDPFLRNLIEPRWYLDWAKPLKRPVGNLTGEISVERALRDMTTPINTQGFEHRSSTTYPNQYPITSLPTAREQAQTRSAPIGSPGPVYEEPQTHGHGPVAAMTFDEMFQHHDWPSLSLPSSPPLGFSGWNVNDQSFAEAMNSHAPLPFSPQPDYCTRGCSTTVLGIIDQFCRFEENPNIHTIDGLFQMTQQAVKATENFCGCVLSCRKAHLLLYIITIHQVDTCYSHLEKRLSVATSSTRNREVELSVGDFKLQTNMNTSIGRLILSSEMERAANCALRLVNILQTEESDDLRGLSDEVQCQQRILQSLSSSLGRKIKD